MSKEDGIIEGDMFDPVTASLEELRDSELTYEQEQHVENYLANRQRCYKAVFSPSGCTEAELEFVMLDLARFCRFQTSTFDDNHGRMALAEGRREVFNRIMDHVSLDRDTFYQRYAATNPKRT